MQRRFSGIFLTWLLVSLTGLGFGVDYLHRLQVRNIATALRRDADSAEEQGQHDKALVSWTRYLAFEPSDADALARYGFTLDQLAASPQDRWQVFLVLDQALRRQPVRLDLRRRFVHVAMDLRQFPTAARHLEILLESSPDDAELEQLLGTCRAATGDYAGAAASWEDSIRHDPQRIDSYADLADVLRRRLDQPRRAEEVMDGMIAANPESFRAYLGRARYRKEMGEPEKAGRDLARARDLAPTAAEVLLAAAEAAQDSGDFETARNDLTRGLQTYPQDGRMYTALAALEVQDGRRKEAIACLRRGLSAASDQAELLPLLADLLIEEGNGDEVGPLVARLRQYGAPQAWADFLHAHLLVQKKQWVEASRFLAGLRPRLTGWPALAARAEIFLGQCYEQMGDPEDQLGAYRRAVAIDPSSSPAHFALGSAWMALGKIDEAVKEYRQTMKLHNPPPTGWSALGQDMVLCNLGMPEGKRDWEEVELVLEQAARAKADPVQLLILRANVLMGQNKKEEARRLLQKAQGQSPDQVEIRVALADLAQRQGQLPVALQMLEEARQQLGDRMEVRLARARYAAFQRRAEARQSLAELEQDLGTFPEEDQARLLRELLATATHLKDISAAERFCQRLAELQPNDLQSRIALLDLALSTGKDDVLQRELADLRRVEGEEGTLWRFAAASRLLLLARRGAGKDLDQAKASLAEAAARRPGWARLPLLEADIDEFQGRPDWAIDPYLRAIGLGDRQPRVVYRLAQLLYERRRYYEANQVVRKLEDVGPLEADLARLAADIALGNHDPERALDLARQAVPADSNDYHDQIWLGQVLQAAGRLPEAEDTLRRAVHLGSSVPDPWVALVRFLIQTEQPAKVDEVLLEVQHQLPLTLARCFEATGREEEAQRQYEAALSAGPGDFIILQNAAAFYLRLDQPREAEPCLRRLMDPAVQAPAGMVAWARRQLALIQAAGGAAEQYREALTLIDRNLAAGGDNVEDQRARALVWGTQPERRQEAIHFLEDSVQRRPLAADEQFRLAQLEAAAGEDDKAAEQLVGLLAVDGHNPVYLVSYIRLLLRQGEVDEAQGWLARLEKVEPQSARTLALKADILKARKATS